MLRFAVDVGYGKTKAIGDASGLERTSRITFPSVYGYFKPLKFTSGMENKDPLSRIVMEYDNQKYFIGESAITQKVAMATIEKNRAMGEEGKALLMTALGLLAEWKQQAINLVVGLPMSDYNDKTKEEYQKAVQGLHKVTFLRYDGSIEKSPLIEVEKVKVLPQPFGTLFTCLLKDDGTLQNQAIANGKVGIIDIGHNTLDLAQADGLVLVESRSESFPRMGMYCVADTLAELINNQFSVNYTPEQAAQFLESDTITIRGKSESLQSFKAEAVRVAASKILSRIKNKWPDMWELNSVIISGGGAAVIGSFLRQELGMEDVTVVSDHPMWKNVEGYYKYACRAWDR